MPGQPDGQPREDDVMPRGADVVSEDVQPVTTDENSDKTAKGSLGGTAGAERTDEADDLQTE